MNDHNNKNQQDTETLDFRAQLDSIEAHELGEHLLEFVKIEGATGQEGRSGAYYARLLRELGLEVSVDEIVPGRANVRGRLPGTGGGPTLVLLGYHDTVPAFGCVVPHIENGQVFGRGAQDMKGGLIAQAEAVRWLKNSGLKLKGDLLVVSVIDHETPVGKKLGPIYFRDQILSGEISPAAIINTVGPKKIWIGSLGMAIIRIRIHPKHPSEHPFFIPVAENPIFAVGEIIHELNEVNKRLAREEADTLCGNSFISLGMVRGGDYPFRLPSEDCVIEGSWSWTSRYNLMAVREELESLATSLMQRSGLKITIELEATREPFYTAPSERVVQAIQEAELNLTGQRAEVFGWAVTGDAHFYRNDCNIPYVYYGVGSETAHSNNERVKLADVVHLAKLLALTAIRFCGLAEGNIVR